MYLFPRRIIDYYLLIHSNHRNIGTIHTHQLTPYRDARALKFARILHCQILLNSVLPLGRPIVQHTINPSRCWDGPRSGMIEPPLPPSILQALTNHDVGMSWDRYDTLPHGTFPLGCLLDDNVRIGCHIIFLVAGSRLVLWDGFVILIWYITLIIYYLIILSCLQSDTRTTRMRTHLTQSSAMGSRSVLHSFARTFPLGSLYHTTDRLLDDLIALSFWFAHPQMVFGRFYLL
jgi:hypothetical protein